MMRGILFTLDALLAALLLISGLILIAEISDHESDTTQISSAGEDVMGALSSMRINDLQHNWVAARIANGTIPDANVTVLEQIGYFWALGETDNAHQLAELLLEDSYSVYGMRITVDDVLVYERNSTRGGNDVIVASRMVSGVAQGKALTGSSAVAYLRRIKDKRTASFLTFGGFIGQGNLSVKLLDVPSDANITNITLELAAGAPFSVRINNIACGGVYTPVDFNGTPTLWNLNACNGSLVPGAENNISINFTAPLNESYVSGGFLRVRYKTSTLSSSINSSFVQYHMPGIDGIANLYDGFYIPGTLVNMSVYLHYNSSNSSYLQIGEKRVWEDSPNGTERFVVLNDSYLRNQSLGKLDYEFLSNKTVPIRFAGFEPSTTQVVGRDADVIIITDYSGSMMKAVADWSQGNLGSDCTDVYADSTTRRTRLAQCVDKELVDTVMEYAGNRVWPVFIHDDQIKWYNNPEDKAAIKGYIDSYGNGKGGTCIACAINQAYDILDTFSNSSRKKFIIVMTDGCPTHCAQGSCVSTSAIFGTQQCDGLCDQSGACDASNIPAQCSACSSNPGAQDNTYAAAQRAFDDLNATIFTVGFGPVDDCAFGNTTLEQVAQIGNGTYQHSRDSTQLRLIYQNISQEILTRSSLVSQTVTNYTNQSRSRLYGDSHINITYDLAEQYEPQQNTISITLQTPQACNPNVTLYDEQQLIEAKAISYSGIHWTDYLGVNGLEAFNLSSFLVSYHDLGDPTVIHAPISYFSIGDNVFNVQTGDSPTNRSVCSVNNSVIYTVVVNLSTERSTVVPNATGCVWEVQFEDNTFETISIPAAYSGTNSCAYKAGNISYDEEDAYQVGAYTIFSRLDFKKEGKLFVNLRDEDLEIIVTTISRIPYLWGPSIVRLEVIR